MKKDKKKQVEKEGEGGMLEDVLEEETPEVASEDEEDEDEDEDW